MQKVYAAKEKDIAVKYDANGFYMEELLPGTYRGGVCNYKCYLRAGSEISPRIYGEDMVVLMFGKGRGYIKTKDCLDKITEIAFPTPAVCHPCIRRYGIRVQCHQDESVGQRTVC